MVSVQRSLIFTGRDLLTWVVLLGGPALIPGVAALAVVTVAGAYLAARKTAPAEGSVGLFDYLLPVFVAAGVGVATIRPLASLMFALDGPPDWAYFPGRLARDFFSPWGGATAMVAQLIWMAAAIAWVARVLSSRRRAAVLAGSAAIVLTLLALGMLVPFAAGRITSPLAASVAAATWGVLLLLICAVVAGLTGRGADTRAGRPMAWVLVGLLSVTLLCGLGRALPVHAGAYGYIATNLESLDDALERLDDMLRRFAAANGCYPAKLQDMVGDTVPKEGVDSSGNPVPTHRPAREDIAGQLDSPLGVGAFAVTELPVDPLTGRNDTWTYEPTGSPMVDSGGYTIELSAGTWSERPVTPRYYQSNSGPPPGKVFDYVSHCVSPGDDVFQSGDTVSYVFPVGGRHKYGHVMVSDGAHAYCAGESARAVEGAALSPDGRSILWAFNGTRSAGLYRSKFGGGDRRQVLARPWPVQVYSVAWHPTVEKWLVVARDLDAEDGKARLYEVEPEGVPRPLSEPEFFISAQYRRDGAGILAMVAYGEWTHPSDKEPLREANWDEAGSRAKMPTGRLMAYSSTGTSPKKLLDDVLVWSLRPSPGGKMVARRPHGKPVKLCHIGGASDRYALPKKDVTLEDLYCDGLSALVITRNPRGSISQQASGDFWGLSPPTSRWTLLGSWVASDVAAPVRVLGAAKETRLAYHIYYAPGGSTAGVYVLSDRSPRLEKLVSQPQLLAAESFEVSVDGQRESVVFAGAFSSADLQVGDWAQFETRIARPHQVRAVTSIEGGKLRQGPYWEDLPADPLPVLSPETKFHVTVRRAEAIELHKASG